MDWREQVDRDMALVPTMTLREAAGFLAGYSCRTFGPRIWSGDLLVGQIRAYADAALQAAWARHEEA